MKLAFLFSVFLTVVATSCVCEATPVVSGVVAHQRTDGSKIVDVYYTLADSTTRALFVSLIISCDGGATYTIVPSSVSGDVGPNVTRGTGKHVVWDADTDLGSTFGADYRVRVAAKETHDVDLLLPSGEITPLVAVPQGTFLMGNSGLGYDDYAGYRPPSELPQHTVFLSSYYIGKHEVTRGEYRQFMLSGGYSSRSYWSDEGWNWKNSTGRTQPSYWDPVQTWNDVTFTQSEDHPVVNVSYYEAEAFCNWAGVHLATEAQWEKAARWNPQVSHASVYPWGDVWDKNRVNNLYSQTTRAGSYPANASYYGCLDMAGNVSEWCKDWYGSNYYSQTPPGGWSNPQGPASGDGGDRVLRGGSWGNTSLGMRCAFRDHGFDTSESYGIFGFRIAVDAPLLTEETNGVGYSGVFSVDNQSHAAPGAYNTQSPQGKHFVPGMPGTLTFRTEVYWDGSPGSVYFGINGARCEARITDLGGGHAEASVTLPAPSAISVCSEVTVEVTNGAGKKTVVNGGLYTHPIPGIVSTWYGDNIHWGLSGTKLTRSDQFTVTFWNASIPSGVYSSKAQYGESRRISFDTNAGTFSGSYGGVGTFDSSLEIQGVENIGVGSLEFAGTLDAKYAGCSPASSTPGWKLSLSGRAGVGFPVVRIVEVFPAATGPIEAVLRVPVLKDLLLAPRLRLFLLGGGAIAGKYDNMQIGPCYLGTTSLTGSLTLGLEGQVAAKVWGAEAGVYVGGTGTPEIQVCPALKWNGMVARVYVGVFGSAWLFSYKQEVGTEFRLWGGSASASAGSVSGSQPIEPVGRWQPIGGSLLEYGNMNRLSGAKQTRAMTSGSPLQSGGSTDEVVIENVTKLSGPCLMADSQASRMLFPLHDPNKPWYAATDIAYFHSDGTNWTLDRVTDDQAAEFTPRAAVPSAGSTLAAWTRVSGDVSQTTSPEQIPPHLDIVVSNLDTASGQWSTPVQLTSNSVTDRDPLPVVFGANKGVLWIQNEADADPGNATNGDRLVYSGWNGSVWSTPQTLWSGKKGLINLAFVADGSGQGHAVFSVDEDGNLDTTTDRELYHSSTTGGSWGSPVRLTNDSAEDSIPTLVAPNGQPLLIWNAGGTLNYSHLGSWNPKAVYSEYTISNEAATLDGVTMPGGAAVAYTVQLPTGVDIVASFYDAALDSWSLPRQLTSDADVETALSLGCDGDQLVVGYLKNRTVRAPVDVVIDGKIQHMEDIPQPSQTDLCVLRHTLGSDLAAGAITVDPANPAPGAAATVTASVENRGDTPESNIDVAFYDGNPLNGGTQIGSTQIIAGPLAAGKSSDVSVSWTVPTGTSSRKVYVVVDQDQSVDDRDRENNTASISCVLPDLIVDTGWSTQASDNAVAMTAKIVNQGVQAAGAFEVGWHVGSPDGPEIGRSPVDSLDAGASTEVTYVWQLPEPSTVEFIQVCAVADCGNTVREADETNNDGYQSVKAPNYEAPTSLTIGAAKQAADRAPMNLDAKIVTAVFSGCLYVEEPNRSCGVRVITGDAYKIGDAVTVTGRLDASGDEVAIDADSVSPATASGTVTPLGMPNRILGGGALGRQAAVENGSGLSSIGLLVRVWGKVTEVGSDYLYVNDGSEIRDGTSTGLEENVGVRVDCDPTGYAQGDYLMVTGICSCFKNASDKLQRKVLVRGPLDIQSNSKLPVSIQRISEAKSAQQGSTITMKDKKVTSTFGGFFYVEEPDRSSGIKVLSDKDVSAGDLASVTGQIGVFNGERQITATSVASQADPLLLRPLGMQTPWLGEAAFGSQPAVAAGFGLSNVGLLVRAWGRITQIGAGYLYIDDGAGLKDGSSTLGVLNQGVRVICDPSGFASGDYVVVTGASSCYPAGFGYGRQIYATDLNHFTP
jgi:formylglycine-generating enzyme required for sulfatase activity